MVGHLKNIFTLQIIIPPELKKIIDFFLKIKWNNWKTRHWNIENYFFHNDYEPGKQIIHLVDL